MSFITQPFDEFLGFQHERVSAIGITVTAYLL